LSFPATVGRQSSIVSSPLQSKPKTIWRSPDHPSPTMEHGRRANQKSFRFRKATSNSQSRIRAQFWSSSRAR